MAFPDWVERHRKPGVELRRQRGKYYAYRVTSKYDAKIKRSRKVTLEYLGAVTEKGLQKPRHKRPPRLGGRYDAGNVVFLDPFVAPLRRVVEASFPEDWQDLLAAAVLKLLYLEPGSRLQLRYDTSLAKRRWPEARLDEKSLPDLLRRVGFQWAAQRDVFRALARDEQHMAIDLSHVFSDSENIPWLEFGHNGDDVWRPQLQVLLCWGTTTHRPGFLQLLLGATHSAQVIATAVKEAPIQDLVAVVDTGFYSPDNVKAFEGADVHYVMALKRDLPFLRLRPHTEYQERFLFRGKTQWWRRDAWQGRTLYHFLDKAILAEEENAWMRRIEQAHDAEVKEKLEAAYRARYPSLGTLSVLTDTGLSAAEAYAMIKERREVEYAYDALQNELRADVTWMRSKEGMIGYHFILFLSLHLYSQVLDHLKRKRLLSTYSVRDVLTYLSKVDVVEVNGQLHALPVTRQTQNVIDRLEVPITERLLL